MGVGHDPKQPSPQIRARLERLETGERLQQRLLQQLLGIGAVARQAERAAAQHIQMLAHIVVESVGEGGIHGGSLAVTVW